MVKQEVSQIPRREGDDANGLSAKKLQRQRIYSTSFLAPSHNLQEPELLRKVIHCVRLHRLQIIPQHKKCSTLPPTKCFEDGSCLDRVSVDKKTESHETQK